ncbi:MAG: HEPN domain-containing protein [Deltaproteobacteria bacterium]|nr:HEPN domain-containing protein [Deltaproteobacteria bacterium]
MSLNDLQKQGLIKPFKVSPSQIQDRLQLAKRDIATARKLLGSDSDWAFSIAYNAVLQAARALMFAKGFRPATGEGQHVAAVRFAEAVLGKEMGDEIFIFDKMRSKRHRVIYDVSGSVSTQEAKAAFEFAVTFVEKVEQILK